LLAEPAVDLLLNVLRLSTRDRDAQAYQCLHDELYRLHHWEEQRDELRAEKMVQSLILSAKNRLDVLDFTTNDPLFTVLMDLINIIGFSNISSHYPQYNQGSFLTDRVRALAQTIADARTRESDLCRMIDDVTGVDIIPAMTIHKSKGLEFHTILFLGLDDSSWWSFANNPEEEKRAFFVAFSRAKEQVIFTYSDRRPGRFGLRTQSRNRINDLYEILSEAGVARVDCRQSRRQ